MSDFDLNEFVKAESERLARELMLKTASHRLQPAVNIVVMERMLVTILAVVCRDRLPKAHEAMEMVYENVTSNLLNIEKVLRDKKAAT